MQRLGLRFEYRCSMAALAVRFSFMPIGCAQLACFREFMYAMHIGGHQHGVST